ncbi:MAG: cation transporter [Brevundimonas sp. 32-68-21]|uniref:Cation transporter n=1 Tax=Brevundimonas mediterranea TaxID=74329 RepID=A0AB37E737_9CAUL|nr:MULTISPECIES: cation diffusion facilitator family transporter [Brevundimonas]OGN47746.1 MAG: cobalt transporter [Caulobacterales bacterium RIFCSPHIGHO2_12_FULL_68_13]OGN51700.1 MAG: cobalt transporter [Caulobacterales bacterium RIFCSPHIGHO2_01_FULL_67_30]OYX80047.1 MAG: cation transporter [Brevundimonas sp. 32-68-21]EDX80904.1 cation efflux family protein [Brevundimonas sp. BAL3]MBA4331674.1 cation transporter [Brevundimonas sp.]
MNVSLEHDHSDHGHDHDDHGHDSSHGHHHHHHGHGHAHGPVDTGDWRYAVGLVVNLAFVFCEFGAGLIADSTALLADAGHNLSDVLGLAMAGGAAWLARRGAHGAAGGRRTYGFGKATVLAALGNALLLIFACGAIAFEAVRRFAEPAPVGSGVIMTVAAIGFFINLGTALLFMKSQHDLNARGAYLHMMADAGVSLGVVAAGGLIMLTGWSLVDPIVSLVIVAVILWSTWGLLKDSVNLAMDGAPADVDVAKLEKALMGLPGVRAVHDLHVWGLSTTETALTAHLVHDREDGVALLMEAQALAKRHSIRHTTLQLESEALPDCPGC